MDLAKQFAQRAAREAGGRPADATTSKFPEAELYSIGIPLSQCIFHRDVGGWTITVSPGVERKTVMSLLQDPVESSKFTQTDVLFFLLGLKNPDTQTSVFDITTDELFRLILNVSPHAQCSVNGTGQRKYLTGRLDRLLPDDGGALTPQHVQSFYCGLEREQEEGLLFPSHFFSRNRRQGEQDAGEVTWFDVLDGIDRSYQLTALSGTKLKDVTKIQKKRALDLKQAAIVGVFVSCARADLERAGGVGEGFGGGVVAESSLFGSRNR